jgi:heat shock protein 5
MIEDSVPGNLSLNSTKHRRQGQTIGVDFGTCFSRIAVFIDGQAELVSDKRGNWNLESKFRMQSESLVGVKRLLGRSLNDSRSELRTVIGQKVVPPWLRRKFDYSEGCKINPEEAASFVFRRLKRVAERRLGKMVRNAVISVPASFDAAQRKAIKRAAEASESRVIHLLNEPTAAALWYFGSQVKIEGSDILALVVHFGGGTFDVSVVWFRSKHFEVLGSDGNSTLGGNDIDDLIVEHFLEIFRARTGKDAGGDLKARAKLRIASEEAKRRLSTVSETMIEIEDLFEGESFSFLFTRYRLEWLISDILKLIGETVKNVLGLCRVVSRDIDQILFCGGSTRIPKVQQVVCGLFDANYTRSSVISDDLIALIAAIDGASLMGDRSVERLIHTNEGSVALQIGEVRSPDWPVFFRDPAFEELLRPWVRLPTKSIANHFWPTFPGQDALHFGLDHGHCPRREENERIGVVSITGLSKGVGVLISVHFNENNEAKVTLKEVQSGRKSSQVFKVYSKQQKRQCRELVDLS